MTTLVSNLFLESVPLSIPETLLTSRPVMDGEPINAAVTNRLSIINAENTALLHTLIKRFRDLSGEYLWQMPISHDVVIGDFVYFDAYAHVFKRGLAKFETHGEQVYESESSLVWGVVVDIRNDKADICTNGLCEFRPSSGGVYFVFSTPGIRFLSDTIAGGLSNEAKSPYKCVGFLVGVKPTGEVQFFVRPYLSVDTTRHQHRLYSLVAAPAGDCEAGVGEIVNADTGLPGWLAAAHPIFEDMAPSDAVYGYNPVFLQSCGWPIQLPSKAFLRWQRTSRIMVEGVETDVAPLQASVPEGMYKIDAASIWWNSEKIVPWDSSLSFVAGQALLEPEQEYAQRLWLEVLSVGRAAAEAMVTTLRTGDSSGLYLRQYPYGGQAVSGDLEIGLNLDLNEEVIPEGFGYAVGEIDANVLKKTPIVSKMRINSRVLRAVSEYKDGAGFHYGALTVSDPTGVMGAEVPVEATHLNGVEEILVRDAVGLAFHNERSTSLLTQLSIPYDDLFRTIAISIRLGLLFFLSSNVPTDVLKLSYRIIKNPLSPNTVSNAFLDTEMLPLTCDFSLTNGTTTYGYYFVESDKVEVSPGDIFILKIERKPPDGYGERLILLRKSGVLHFV